MQWGRKVKEAIALSSVTIYMEYHCKLGWLGFKAHMHHSILLPGRRKVP